MNCRNCAFQHTILAVYKNKGTHAERIFHLVAPGECVQEIPANSHHDAEHISQLSENLEHSTVEVYSWLKQRCRRAYLESIFATMNDCCLGIRRAIRGNFTRNFALSSERAAISPCPIAFPSICNMSNK